MTAIRFQIDGSLLPWKRAIRTSRGPVVTEPDQRDYQGLVQLLWMSQLARERRTWPTTSRYAVAMVITWPDARRRDVDNAAKQILDSLNGFAWDDDSQVDALFVLRTSPHTVPCARVVISTMRVLAWAQAAAWWAEMGALSFLGRVARLFGYVPEDVLEDGGR